LYLTANTVFLVLSTGFCDTRRNAGYPPAAGERIDQQSGEFVLKKLDGQPFIGPLSARGISRAALTYVKKRRVFIGSHTRQTREKRPEKSRTDLV